MQLKILVLTLLVCSETAALFPPAFANPPNSDHKAKYFKLDPIVEEAFDRYEAALHERVEYSRTHDDLKKFELNDSTLLVENKRQKEFGCLPASTREHLPKSICHAYDYWENKTGNDGGAQLWKIKNGSKSGYLLFASYVGNYNRTPLDSGYSEVFNLNGDFLCGCYWMESPQQPYSELKSWMASVASKWRIPVSHPEVSARFDESILRNLENAAREYNLREREAANKSQVNTAPKSAGSEKPPVRWTKGSVEISAFVPDDNMTPNFDSFMADLENRIKRTWVPPGSAASRRVQVIFKVHTQGELSDLRIEISSGLATANMAALQAIQNAAPFHPLPAGAPKLVDVRFTFDPQNK